MHLNQMKKRCPKAQVLGSGELFDYRITFVASNLAWPMLKKCPAGECRLCFGKLPRNANGRWIAMKATRSCAKKDKGEGARGKWRARRHALCYGRGVRKHACWRCRAITTLKSFGKGTRTMAFLRSHCLKRWQVPTQKCKRNKGKGQSSN